MTTAGHPLSGDPYADLAEIVLRAAREISFHEPDDPETISLTPSNGNVMRHVDRHPGATPSEVAHATGLRRSNLSAALKELERIGFVDRRFEPADGRVVRLFPTPRAAENLRRTRAEWARQVFGALGGDVDPRSSIVLLERLTDGLIASRQREHQR